MLRLERHPFGPRVYVLRRRIHEYHLGLAILTALAVGTLFDDVEFGLTSSIAALAGLWLVAKDWRDLGSVQARLGDVAARPASAGRAATRPAALRISAATRRPRRRGSRDRQPRLGGDAELRLAASHPRDSTS